MTTRENALNIILDEIPKDALVVTCNGKIGREVWELRKKRGEPNEDFIMLGSMGCAIGIALGVALNTEKLVYCLVGDGNLLMKLGSLASALKYNDGNLRIIVINNDCHDSTGGQTTAFWAIRDYLPFIEIVDVVRGARDTLGRPTQSPKEITESFMKKCATTTI